MDDLIKSIASIRADLAEARRYVTTHPALVASKLTRLSEAIDKTFDMIDTRLPANISVPLWISDRIVRNLEIAARDILACPDMTRGYIEATLWELAWVAGRLERGCTRAAGDVKTES